MLCSGGSAWAASCSWCWVMGRWERWGGGQSACLQTDGRCFLSRRKELKDPDQLYNTLKNLLAQIKVQTGGSPPLWGACPHNSPRSCVPWDRLSWLCLRGGKGGDPGAWGAAPPCDGAGRGCSNLPPPCPQTHPSAWPFMEPVKKSEAPDYYEIIRFPIGRWLCPEPRGRMVEGGAADTPIVGSVDPLIVGSVLGSHGWSAGSPRPLQKREG